MSNYNLTNSDYELLEKGLSFIPTKKILPISNIINSQNKIIQNIKLNAYFVNRKITSTYTSKKFTEPKNWTPSDYLLDNKTLNITDKIKLCTSDVIEKYKSTNKHNINTVCKFSDEPIIRLKDKNNLNKEERISLVNLRNNSDIIIKPADKGGATVILNRENYIIEAERQLNNEKYYKKIPKPIFTDNIPKIRNILLDMLNEKFITKDQFNYLSGPTDIRQRIFYLLPKIHKKTESWPQKDRMPEGRPIVSDVNSETYRVSEYIDYYINHLGINHEAYIKNTYDFINKIRNFAINNDCLLITGDVSSLYTNMDINRSIECVRRVFNNSPDITRPDNYILKLLEISLKNNDFDFNGKCYIQIMGTAMGKRFAPSLANIYLLDFDQMARNGFKIKPLLYFRFLDDIFVLFPNKNIELVKEYENFLSNIIPDIKVTLEWSDERINFLDTTIYINNNTLQTKVFFKPTDTHQLLHKSSFHPSHTFKGILKSQLIRFKRISSSETDYNCTCKILFSYLKNRGYSHTEMRKMKHEIWYNYVEKDPDINKDNNTKLFPIIIDYCSIGIDMGHSYKKMLSTEYSIKTKPGVDNNIKLILAYKNNKNLKQILVRSKLESNKKGAFRGCGTKTCKCCQTHAVDSNKIHSSALNKSFMISDNISCNSSNIIYVITCRRCNLQYVGETSRTLRDRLSDHCSAIRTCKNTPIGTHFNLPQHSILDLKIIGLETIKNENNSDKLRKSREKHWQNCLSTMHPRGLNGLQ